MNDISVSRCHSIIKYKEGSFFLEDNISKFGTLVLLRGLQEIKLNYTHAVQIGRTVVSFAAKNTNPERPQDR